MALAFGNRRVVELDLRRELEDQSTLGVSIVFSATERDRSAFE